jgi:hypothetical protein
MVSPSLGVLRRWALGSPDCAALTLAEWVRREECLHHIVIFGEARLRQVLKAYAAYYNHVRTHLSLGKDAPLIRPIQRFGNIAATPLFGGLHHQYCRM